MSDKKSSLMTKVKFDEESHRVVSTPGYVITEVPDTLTPGKSSTKPGKKYIDDV